MVLQRYRAKAELGKGSFGTVYLTEGRRDKKPYVVKVVDNLREGSLKVQEIRVMMHLKHRNICTMCDFYTSNNQLCIVMDFADGGDLRKEIMKARNGKTQISEDLISCWIIQVCHALDYAHEEQIIHRDMKPSNIFLMADGHTVRVGDFGISKVCQA
ncbi:kinase-like domain-containing protein [Baffinella frigidus]|nr:kinase-like domain-containing protein [Cryptophyta sp. CCMP2293]